MLFFSGFNGFGQFGRAHASRVLQPTQFESNWVPGEILIHPTWSCNLIAVQNMLFLYGYVYMKSEKAIEFPEKITAICSNDKICLILIQTERLFKLNRINLQVEEVKFADLDLAPRKRKLFERNDDHASGSNTAEIKLIACGSNLAVAISSNNSVYNIPSKIHQFPTHEKIVALKCGFEHALVLNSNGDVYSWGNGLRGQLGIDDMSLQEAPVLIEALAGIKVISIAASGWHSAAVSSFGDIYTWGFNCNGQLGIRVFQSNGVKNPTVYPLPQLIDLPPCCESTYHKTGESACNPVAVFSGARHTIVKSSCGSIHVSGWNAYGQLSLPNAGNMVDEFKKLTNAPTSVEDIICGPWSTIFKINTN